MGFSMSELLILMVIGVIIFGPEDLPDIARTVGKFVYEIKKMFNDATKDFKEATKDITDVIQTPSNVIQKTIDDAVKPALDSVKPALDFNSTGTAKQVDDAQKGNEAEDLLTYDEVEKSSSEPQVEIKETEVDPLADLPKDMVTYKVEK